MKHHLVEAAIPHIKFPDDTDAARPGRPYDETCSRRAVYRLPVSAKLFINLVVLSLSKNITVKIRKGLPIGIGILHIDDIIFPVFHPELVFCQTVLLLRDHIAEKALHRHLFHLADLPALLIQKPDLLCAGTVCRKYLYILFFEDMAAQ